MIYRFPSLETRWLQRSEKWMTQPMVALGDESSCPGGACYYQRCPEAVLVDGREIYLGDAGLIVLRPDGLPELSETASDIAHEWRHCWQEQAGFQFDSVRVTSILSQKLSYETSVRRYFLAFKSEADALWFQWKKTHSPLSEYWVGLVAS